MASCVNFLIGNDIIIAAQYDDINDDSAIVQLEKALFQHHVMGVHKKDLVFGGINIYYTNWQQPAMVKKCII
ncbi:agmatine deiminase family protein [Psychrobacter glacincola]|uniref:agmatine deiminase family protein n=1 Tax=Psychrobacter glacincola TaxID=56810 RepID=UPI003BB632D1